LDRVLWGDPESLAMRALCGLVVGGSLGWVAALAALAALR
jgi:hypothetical protein